MSEELITRFSHLIFSCITTVATQPLKPGLPYDHADHIMVGNCDHGKFMFNVSSGTNTKLVSIGPQYNSHVFYLYRLTTGELISF